MYIDIIIEIKKKFIIISVCIDRWIDRLSCIFHEEPPRIYNNIAMSFFLKKKVFLNTTCSTIETNGYN